MTPEDKAAAWDMLVNDVLPDKSPFRLMGNGEVGRWVGDMDGSDNGWSHDQAWVDFSCSYVVGAILRIQKLYGAEVGEPGLKA